MFCEIKTLVLAEKLTDSFCRMSCYQWTLWWFSVCNDIIYNNLWMTIYTGIYIYIFKLIEYNNDNDKFALMEFIILYTIYVYYLGDHMTN